MHVHRLFPHDNQLASLYGGISMYCLAACMLWADRRGWGGIITCSVAIQQEYSKSQNAGCELDYHLLFRTKNMGNDLH